MFVKEILMALFLPVIGVLICLVVIFLRAMDGLARQLDIGKVKSRIPRREDLQNTKHNGVKK